MLYMPDPRPMVRAIIDWQNAITGLLDAIDKAGLIA